MTELTRADLNRYLPDDQTLRLRVERIIGFAPGSDDHMVVRGLEWLGNMTEEFGEVWVNGETKKEDFLSLTFNGLYYKRSWEEAVSLEVPQGEWGWLVVLAHGVEDVEVYGDTPAAAIARSIVLMDLLRHDWLVDEPNMRGLSVAEMIEARMAAGTWSP